MKLITPFQRVCTNNHLQVYRDLHAVVERFLSGEYDSLKETETLKAIFGHEVELVEDFRDIYLNNRSQSRGSRPISNASSTSSTSQSMENGWVLGNDRHLSWKGTIGHSGKTEVHKVVR